MLTPCTLVPCSALLCLLARAFPANLCVLLRWLPGRTIHLLYTLIGQARLTVRHSEWAAVLTSRPLNLLPALLLDPYIENLASSTPTKPHVQPFLDARWEETSPIPPMSLSFSGKSTDVTNSDTHVPKWIQDGCSSFSLCMQRDPRLRKMHRFRIPTCHYVEEVLQSGLPCPGLLPTPGPVPLTLKPVSCRFWFI